MLRACHACGLVHRVEQPPPRDTARCSRCRAAIRLRPHPRSASRTLALAMAALILYPAAITMPVLELTRMGHTNESSIWSGVVALFADGQPAIGLIVLFCSVIAPLGKLALLGVLCAGELVLKRHTHRAATYRIVEFLGRWGMVDVLLVALLVAAVKLGDLVQVHAGPGIAVFAAVVVLSTLATASFDPHAIWDTPEAA